jgi:hypothetical protein
LLAAPVTVQEPKELSMSMFATRAELEKARAAQEAASAPGERQPVAWMMADGSSAISLRCKEDGQHRGNGWVNSYTVPLYE